VSFYTDESGQDSAEPIELYTFTTTSTTFRYTSGPEDYLYDAQTYTRASIKRDPIKIFTTREKQEVGIDMPANTPVVADLGHLIAPVNTTMTIRRIHPSTASTEIIFRGKVVQVTIKGRMAKIVCDPVLSVALDASFPSRVFTRFCNHQLFDTRCGLTKASYAYTTTVASVDGSEVVLAADAGDPNSPQNLGPTQRFSGGEILRVTDGERRRIVRQDDHGITGAYPGVPDDALAARTLYLNMPFRDLDVGDSVTIHPGCAKSPYECKHKFNNIARFGGFPLIPLKNIYTSTGGIKGVD
jgi:uncharacterized phage protein (TIGR02218 family)